MRPELELISEWIRPGARVLDLGCGDGALLAYLHERRQVSGYGLEIDSANIVKCIQAGVNVIHADLEAGLEDFGDGAIADATHGPRLNKGEVHPMKSSLVRSSG